MKRIVGYIIAGLGLLILAFNSAIGKQFLPFLTSIDQKIMLIPAIIMICIGVVILIVMSEGKGKWSLKQIEREVPIYQGEGKKRKIIGYKVEG